MTKNLRHARNLQLALLVILVLVGGVSAALLLNTIESRYDELVTRSLSGTQDSARVIQVTFKKQVQNWKNILLRGRSADQLAKYRTQFHDDESAVRTRAGALKAALSDDAEARQLLEAFLTSHDDLSKNYATALRLFEASGGTGYETADAAVNGQDRAPTDALDKLVAHLAARLEQERKDVDAFVLRSELVGGVLILLGVGAIGAYLVIMMTAVTTGIENVTEGLREGVHQVAAAAEQVATSSQGLSAGATEQAASLEETSASMEEMSSMTRKNAENSQTASTLMTEVEQRVAQSTEALAAMVGSMSAIQESSDKVAKIIKTIDEIAFQTNILALNAAVEAARAGEVGMGFAVVADEVRNLAQRSAQAARDTTALIEESIQSSTSGSARVRNVEAAIQSIVDSVTKVKGFVDEVSVSSRQQAQGIQQVSQAITQMEKVTQTTAATAEESAAASEELNAQAEMSRELVAELRRLAGRVHDHRPSKPVLVHRAEQTPATKNQFPMDDDVSSAKTGTYGGF
jgi:methyl-accepting chemotaxis protein